MTKPAQRIEITSPARRQNCWPQSQSPWSTIRFQLFICLLLHDFYILLFLQQVSWNTLTVFTQISLVSHSSQHPAASHIRFSLGCLHQPLNCPMPSLPLQSLFDTLRLEFLLEHKPDHNPPLFKTLPGFPSHSESKVLSMACRNLRLVCAPLPPPLTALTLTSVPTTLPSSPAFLTAMTLTPISSHTHIWSNSKTSELCSQDILISWIWPLPTPPLPPPWSDPPASHTWTIQ